MAARSDGFGGGVEWVGGRWQPNRQSVAAARSARVLESLVEHGLRQLSRSELNLYSSVHGWRSKRWVLGVRGSVMREGWVEIFKCVMFVSVCEDCVRSVNHLKVK